MTEQSMAEYVHVDSTEFHLEKSADQIAADLAEKHRFTVDREIDRSVVYKDNKVGSVIYAVEMHDGTKAVLKLQGLNLGIDESERFQGFMAQNRSVRIRTPKLFVAEAWEAGRGYGYILMEHIEGEILYAVPFADETGRETFLSAYDEYRRESCNDRFIEGEPMTDTKAFIRGRITRWTAASKNLGYCDEAKEALADRYLTFVDEHADAVPMEFQHGHLTVNDIIETKDGDLVLFSNLFWQDRPAYYDATFHLWHGLCASSKEQRPIDEIITYLDTWQRETRALDSVQDKALFDRAWQLNMLERCVGALLMDVPNLAVSDEEKAYLRGLFEALFAHYIEDC